MEGEEVRALAALDVDDLDVLALAHLVGERAGAVDAEVQARLGQRRRQLDLAGRPRRSARRISTTSAEAGGSPSTTRPPGAPTTTSRLALGQ